MNLENFENNFHSYDLLFVGAGISCSLTLISLLDQICQNPPKSKIDILVLDKYPEFWTGIPYGSRSSKKALMITSLGEFLPVKQENEFLTWFEENKKKYTDEIKINHSLENEKIENDWLNYNYKNVNSQNLKKVYLPRYIFGDFIKKHLEDKIKKCVFLGLIDLKTHCGEVIEVNKFNEVYEVKFKTSFEVIRIARSKKVILSFGHLERKKFKFEKKEIKNNFFSDPFEPTIDFNLSLLNRNLTDIDLQLSNILIIGTNASAVELLYIIKEDSKLLQKINKIYLFSPSGKLPSPISGENNCSFDFPNLNTLIKISNLTANELMNSIEMDISALVELNISVADGYYSISSLVVQLLNELGPAERKKFHDNFGMRFTNLIRRSGTDYYRAIYYLDLLGKIEIIKGTLCEFKEEIIAGKTSKFFKVIYNNSQNIEPIEFGVPFYSVFNCSGYMEVQDSESLLIKWLISNKLCKKNKNSRGLEVNNRFEGNNNLFIIGPLLGSLYTPSFKYWHVENAKRLGELGYELAHILVN